MWAQSKNIPIFTRWWYRKEKAKGTKNCVIKHCLKFNDYKDSIFNKKTTLRLQQRFKSDNYTIYTKDVNKIAISSNDDKRLQTNNKIMTYPYATPAIKVCESELLSLIFKLKKKIHNTWVGIFISKINTHNIWERISISKILKPLCMNFYCYYYNICQYNTLVGIFISKITKYIEKIDKDI